jgi:hypothetical protein
MVLMEQFTHLDNTSASYFGHNTGTFGSTEALNTTNTVVSLAGWNIGYNSVAYCRENLQYSAPIIYRDFLLILVHYKIMVDHLLS